MIKIHLKHKKSIVLLYYKYEYNKAHEYAFMNFNIDNMIIQ